MSINRHFTHPLINQFTNQLGTTTGLWEEQPQNRRQGLKYGYKEVRMDLLTVVVLKDDQELDRLFVFDIGEANRELQSLIAIHPDATDINVGATEDSMVNLWKRY